MIPVKIAFLPILLAWPERVVLIVSLASVWLATFWVKDSGNGKIVIQGRPAV